MINNNNNNNNNNIDTIAAINDTTGVLADSSCEYLENHEQEFSDMTVAADEINEGEITPVCTCGDDECTNTCGEEVVTQDDINWAAIYGVRDNIDTFSDEQMGILKAIIKDNGREESAKARVYAEASTIYNNCERLKKFLNGWTKDGIRNVEAMRLTQAQQYLMHKQLELMQEYYNVLVARLSVWDVKVKENSDDEIELDVGGDNGPAAAMN